MRVHECARPLDAAGAIASAMSNTKNKGDPAMRSIFLAAISAGALLFSAAPASAQADVAGGQKLFAQRCAMCHGTTAAEKKPLGPHLAGIIGRKAASVSDFKYSPAFAKLDQSWNDKNLDEYLAAPAKAVPGTTMVIAVPQAPDREDLIAYLKTLK